MNVRYRRITAAKIIGGRAIIKQSYRSGIAIGDINMPEISLTDPYMRAQVVDAYMRSGGDRLVWRFGIELAADVYNKSQEVIKEKEKLDSANKKQNENKEFFNQLAISGELKILFIEIMLDERQQELREEVRQDVERAEKAFYQAQQEQQTQMQQVNVQLDKPMDLNAIVITSAVKAIEKKIMELDSRIENIHKNWGKTWEEGRDKFAEKLSKDFGRDLLGPDPSKETKKHIENAEKAVSDKIKNMATDEQLTKITSEQGLSLSTPQKAERRTLIMDIIMFGERKNLLDNLKSKDPDKIGIKNIARDAGGAYRKELNAAHDSGNLPELMQQKEKLEKDSRDLIATIGNPTLAFELEQTKINTNIQALEKTLFDTTIRETKMELGKIGIKESDVDSMLKTIAEKNPKFLPEIKERIGNIESKDPNAVGAAYSGILRDLLTEFKKDHTDIAVMKAATAITNSTIKYISPKLDKLHEQRDILQEKQAQHKAAPDTPEHTATAPRMS